MMHYLSIVFCFVAAYVVGGLNTGYYLVKYTSGGDLREKYSGNAGATNAGRVLGKKGFILAFLGDFTKGLLVLAWARFLGFENNVLLLLIPACVLGHMFPVQLGFRGGKGMSTVGGALLGYNPLLFLISFSIFGALIFITKSRVFGGLTGLLFVTFIAFFLDHNFLESTVLFLTSLLIIVKHREDLISSFKKQTSGE